MWQKKINITPADMRHLEVFSADDSPLIYICDSTVHHAYVSVKIGRRIGERQWTLELNRNLPTPEEIERDGGYSTSQMVQYADKKLLGMYIKKVLSSDPTFQACADEIYTTTGIDYNGCYAEKPEWWLENGQPCETLSYRSHTHNKVLHVRLNHNNHLGLIIKPGEDDYHWFRGITNESLDIVENYLIAVNISTNPEMIKHIISGIQMLMQENAAQRNDPAQQGSATHHLMLNQLPGRQLEEEWTLEFERYIRLECGVRTERSEQLLSVLTKKMLDRNKNVFAYNQWLKQNHGKVKNHDDLRYLAKKENFYQKFIHSDNVTFKAYLLSLLPVYINQLGIVIEDESFETTDIVRLRREIYDKRSSEPYMVDIALLILAKYWPLNDVDPITFEPIEECNRVFVATGHQFDIRSLIAWHATRAFRNGESKDNKLLFHPVLDAPFSAFNADYIFEMVKKHPETRGLKLPKRKMDNAFRSSGYDLRNIVGDIEITGMLEAAPKSVSFVRYADFLRRALRLPSSQQELLLKNMAGDAFEDGLLFSILESTVLSVEAFAALDSERQHIIVLNERFEHMLIYWGVDPDKLLNLSAEHLNEIGSLPLPARANAHTLQNFFNHEIDQRLALQKEAEKQTSASGSRLVT